MLGTESLGEPFRLRVEQLPSPTLPWAKPHPNHVFQTPPVFLPTVSALMVQISRPRLNQRTATRDANFDRRGGALAVLLLVCALWMYED